jgi:hypothetical protein
VLLLVITSSVTDAVTSSAGSRTKITVCVPKATRRVAFGTQTVITALRATDRHLDDPIAWLTD